MRDRDANMDSTGTIIYKDTSFTFVTITLSISHTHPNLGHGGERISAGAKNRRVFYLESWQRKFRKSKNALMLADLIGRKVFFSGLFLEYGYELFLSVAAREVLYLAR